MIKKFSESTQLKKMAVELKAKFEGKWENVKSENLKEFLDKAGVGMIKRNIAAQFTPTIVISVEGETVNVSITAGPKKDKVSYKLGEGYDIEGINPGKAVTTLVEGKMNTVITPNNKDLKLHTVVNDIVDGQLVQTLTTDGVTAKRYFKRSS
ncbi:fatty acid-binding protein, adipocyte-like [Mercenaria mercenaria]|uniref:fatty acid-binding protein, adipocyte-like n=1 Tax=Mercenaria mercenaria TaxID=6596 RepID=UPI00234EA2CD|nr:fatty acid-binding protein, adipocyte-like [Mercenaria mercenaria]